MPPSNSYLEFGFGENDERVGGGRITPFKGKEGETYRVSFIWWPFNSDGTMNLNAATPRFIGAKRMYIPGVGYVLDKGPEYAQFGASKVNVATIIAIWPTTRNGSLDKARFAAGELDIKPWVFGKDKYEQLKRRHEEFPFNNFDMSIACTDSQFQKMDMSPCRESLFRKVMESDKTKELAADIMARVKELEASMQDTLARDVSIEKIREKLTGAPPASNGGGKHGSGAAGASTVAIDDLLEDV